MTYFNQQDRQYLYQELEEALYDLDYTDEEINNILKNCKSMNNVELRDECVGWMPDCMDNLNYNRTRRITQ